VRKDKEQLRASRAQPSGKDKPPRGIEGRMCLDGLAREILGGAAVVGSSLTPVVARRPRDGSKYRREGEKNGNAILSLEQVRTIRASSEVGAKLAADYGVHKNTIYAIKKGRRWRSES